MTSEHNSEPPKCDIESKRSNRITKICRAIEVELRDYWQNSYKEYLEGEDTDVGIWEENWLSSKELSESVRAAYQFYLETVEQEDVGSVSAYRIEIDEEAIDIVYVVTDGDDGWLEAYDGEGNLLGVARRYIELLAWGDVEDVEDVRQQVETHNFPPSFDREATLWGK
ncbi:MAG: hypothetical protein WBG70_06065 [Spirulinaceae cyanobacterium]